MIGNIGALMDTCSTVAIIVWEEHILVTIPCELRNYEVPVGALKRIYCYSSHAEHASVPPRFLILFSFL